MQPRRVVFISHYSDLGGANRSLCDLIRGLTPARLTSLVLLPRQGPAVAALRAAGAEVCVVPFRRSMVGTVQARYGQRSVLRGLRGCVARGLGALKLPGEILALEREARAFAPQLLYSNSLVTSAGFYLSRRLQLPHIWHARENPHFYGVTPRLGWRLQRAMLSSADCVIAVSHAVRREVLAGVSPRRLKVIYNGVLDEAGLDALCCGARPRSEETVFALVGQYHPSKGQLEAVNALAHLITRGARARLLLAGGGDGGVLRDEVLRLGVAEQVELLGETPDPWQVYARADVGLCCSTWEAMGRVTVEAMAAALPVIGRESGGTPELVEHEHTGLLYGGGVPALAEAMQTMISQPEWRKQLGRNGRVAARRSYTVEHYAAAVYAEIQAVLGAPADGTSARPQCSAPRPG